MKPDKKDIEYVLERLRKLSLRDKDAFGYYHFCERLKVKNIENRSLYEKGKDIYNEVLVEDVIERILNEDDEISCF